MQQVPKSIPFKLVCIKVYELNNESNEYINYTSENIELYTKQWLSELVVLWFHIHLSTNIFIVFSVDYKPHK